jgi:hypothetical protein
MFVNNVGIWLENSFKIKAEGSESFPYEQKVLFMWYLGGEDVGNGIDFPAIEVAGA